MARRADRADHASQVSLRPRRMNETSAPIQTLEESLEELLSPRRANTAPTREQVERVLTDGYAHALELEAERVRCSRRLQAEADPAEALWLGRELSACNERLVDLRARLARVSERYGRNPLAEL